MSVIKFYELIYELVKKDNAVPIKEFYNRKLGDYEIFINGNNERTYNGLNIPAYTILIKKNGWIEGILDPFGYVFTGDNKEFMKALKKERGEDNV